MKPILKGRIINFEPVIGAAIYEGRLALGEEDFILTVDTGFSGAIALPQSILEKMDLEFTGYDVFSLATGQIVELPVFTGQVLIGGRVFETWFIPGEYLVGMEFLSTIAKQLSLDFERASVEIALRV